MIALSLLALVAWIALVAARGGFWRADQVLPAAQDPSRWPSVAVLIPARDEARTIRRVASAHRSADYPGALSIIVCDDGSSDGTAEEARAASGDRPLTVLDVPPLPAGWSGKLWALETGMRHLEAMDAPPDMILLTDADIVPGPALLRKLVAAAEKEGLALTSIMARLDTSGRWGRLLIPAFVFFFQKLYPFGLVNDPENPAAGAAGGVALVRRDALAAIGGIEALRGALIDDCTLAQKIKSHAPGTRIGLYLSSEFAQAVSLRTNADYRTVELMVARTAYAQLGYNPAALVGTLFGLFLVYLVPPLAVLLGPLHGEAQVFWAGLMAWALMTFAYGPTLKRYGCTRREALLLPVAAAIYGWFTWLSAWRHWRGRGNRWKGRSYGAAGES